MILETRNAYLDVYVIELSGVYALSTQVLNAQEAGFAAAIVYNNHSDRLITMHGGKCKLLPVLNSHYVNISQVMASYSGLWGSILIMCLIKGLDGLCP